MARSVEVILRELCGAQLLQIAQLTAMVEALQEQLAAKDKEEKKDE